MTENRRVFNDEMIGKFKGYLKEHDLVYDIGKSLHWNYRPYFEQQRYIVVDRDANVHPDIIDNLEHTQIAANSADAVICQGVWEECDNPFELLRGINTILKAGGIALFGIVSTGLPAVNSTDRWRFTYNGAKKLLEDMLILEYRAVKVEDTDELEYMFFIVQKKE